MKVFTIDQVAEICKVVPRTIKKWLDSGLLIGCCCPNSQERHIPCEHLIKFLREHGMPVPGDLEDKAVDKEICK
jgi:phage terminase Nu1 subunit (DNA packaging protein)